MRRDFDKYLKFVLLTALLLNSCTLRKIERGPEENGLIPIRWSPYARQMSDPQDGRKGTTKSIVNHDEDLMRECTPLGETYYDEPGGGNGIGFWADYLEYNDGKVTRIPDIFGYRETKLAYMSKDGGPQAWNYVANDLYWAIGGKYKIRAYYPQSVADQIITESTNSDIIVMQYNSHLLQEDVLVAYNEVHTVDPYTGTSSIALSTGEGFWPEETLSEEVGTGEWKGYSQEFSLNDVIPLFFNHVMAAIRVRFCYAFDNSDVLYSCNFSNKSSENGFHTVGVLLYGDSSAANTLASNTQMSWISYQSSFDETEVYSWEVEDEEYGIEFGSSTTPFMKLETMAVPYTKYGKQIIVQDLGLGYPDQNEDNQFTTPIPLKRKNPPYYTENDGWILVVPQAQKSDVQIVFRTKKCGEMKVDLPLFTGTRQDGTLSNDMTDPEARYLLPGHRYTYTVRIRRTDVDVDVTMEPWNEYYVNEGIIF